MTEGTKVSSFGTYSVAQMIARESTIKLHAIGNNDSSVLDNYTIKLTDLYSYTAGKILPSSLTAGYIPRVSGTSILTNSNIRDDGSNIGIFTAPNTSYKVDIAGAVRVNNTLRVKRTNSSANIAEFYSFAADAGLVVNAFGQTVIDNGGTNVTTLFIGTPNASIQFQRAANFSWTNTNNAIGSYSTLGTFAGGSNTKLVIVADNQQSSSPGLVIAGNMSLGQLSSNSLISLKHWENSGVLKFENGSTVQSYTLINANIAVDQNSSTNKTLVFLDFNPSITGTLGHVYGLLMRTGFNGFGTATPTSRLDASSTNGYEQLRLRTAYTPANTAASAGETGQISWDDSYIYVKTSAGWKRAALSTF